MKDRIPCCVPFCRRTTRRRPEWTGEVEWICGPHWKAVPRDLKLNVSRWRRRLRADPGSAKAAFRFDMAWRRCRRVAIEAAGGIG